MKQSGFGIASLILGILGFLGSCFVFGIVPSVLGIILAIIGLLSTKIFVLTILCFALVRFLAGASNSTITSITPLFLKGKVEPGRIAGLLNGCCYAGSTISSYGLGVIADQHGWNSVFYLLFAVCLFVVLLACVYMSILGYKAKKQKAK